MLNYNDVQLLRQRGMNNSDILQTIAKVVPSASKAYSDMQADKNTPQGAKDSIIGKMLDSMTPKNAPSGLPYMNALGISSAQKSHDIINNGYQEASGEPEKPGFLSSIGKGLTSTLKGVARTAISGPAYVTANMFKTADDLSSFLSGKDSKPLTPEQQEFFKKTLPNTAYQDAPGFASLMTLGAGAPAITAMKLAGGLTMSKLSLAKAGYAPEGSPIGKDVPLASIPIEGARAAANFIPFGKGIIGGAVAGTLMTAGNKILDNMMYGNGERQSLSELAGESIGSGLAFGGMNAAARPMEAIKAVKSFINGEGIKTSANPSVDGPTSGEGANPQEAPSAAKGQQYKMPKTASMAQGAIEQLTGLQSDSQQVAGDPQLRGLTKDFLSGEQNPQKLVLDGFSSAFEDSMKTVSDTGKEYNFVRNSKQVMPTPSEKINGLLDKYGYRFKPDGEIRINPVDGTPMQMGSIEAGETAQAISPNQFASLAKVVQMMNYPEMTPATLRAARKTLTDLGGFYDAQLPGGGGEIRGLAGEMLSTLDNARKAPDAPSDFKEYAALDEKYAPLRRQYEDIKGQFFEKDPVSGELRFKDNAPTKILNALRGTKYNLLQDIERAAPGITKQLKAYEAYRDITTNNTPGQYVKTLAKAGGAALAGNAAAGGLGALAAGLATIFASSPLVMFNALSRYSDVAGRVGWDPLGIVMKAEHGAKFTPEEAAAIQGTIKVISEKYNVSAPKAENVDMKALVKKYGSEDAIPLDELSPQGKADAAEGKKILEKGGKVEDAVKVSGTKN